MSRPSCITCGVNAAASSCQHQLHARADHKNLTFSIFPDLHDQLVMQPQEGLHEFQFFGQSDHESVAWLFDDDPPPTIDGNRFPEENHLYHRFRRPSTFHPLGQQYHPGNGLTFEVSLDKREVDAGQQLMEPAASATIVSSGPKESPIGSGRCGVLCEYFFLA